MLEISDTCQRELPKRKKCVAINKVKKGQRSEEHFDIRHGDTEVRVCPAGFQLTLVQYFLPVLPLLSFGMVMYVGSM